MTKDMCDLGVSWGTASHPELHLYLVSAVAAPPLSLYPSIFYTSVLDYQNSQET